MLRDAGVGRWARPEVQIFAPYLDYPIEHGNHASNSETDGDPGVCRGYGIIGGVAAPSKRIPQTGIARVWRACVPVSPIGPGDVIAPIRPPRKLGVGGGPLQVHPRGLGRVPRRKFLGPGPEVRIVTSSGSYEGAEWTIETICLGGLNDTNYAADDLHVGFGGRDVVGLSFELVIEDPQLMAILAVIIGEPVDARL